MRLPWRQVYEGEWKNDLMHGLGTMVYKNGKVRQGMWVCNKPA
jgi:antitoxin component YwqK of YwqJK toxin-antitoxin module